MNQGRGLNNNLTSEQKETTNKITDGRTKDRKRQVPTVTIEK